MHILAPGGLFKKKSPRSSLRSRAEC